MVPVHHWQWLSLGPRTRLATGPAPTHSLLAVWALLCDLIVAWPRYLWCLHAPPPSLPFPLASSTAPSPTPLVNPFFRRTDIFPSPKCVFLTPPHPAMTMVFLQSCVVSGAGPLCGRGP